MGTKISALPAATTPGTADLLPIVQGGVTKRTTLGALFSALTAFFQPGSNVTSRSTQTKLQEMEVSLTDFQNTDLTTPLGNGIMDCSSAWARLLAYANAQVSAAVSSGYPISTVRAIFPSGDWVITTGGAVANCNLILEGRGKENTRVRIGAGQYFLTVSSSIYQFELRRFSFSGGKGCLKHTAVGTNVQGMIVVEDNNFQDYTECALGSLSSDLPDVKIKRNLFYGTTSSKGVALAGLTDGVCISDNAFNLNKYHIKLGKGGNNAKVMCNDFIRFVNGGGAPALTDTWLVPQTTATNAGQGFLSFGNKFGNENINNADYRYLIADEAAGTDFVTKDHATTASTGFVVGLRSLANAISGAGTPTNGVFYSYVPNNHFLSTKIDDLYYGSHYPYIVQFDAGTTTSNDRLSASNFISLSHLESPFESNWGEYSNIPGMGIVEDPFGIQSGFLSFRQNYETGFDPGYKNLTTTTMNARNLTLNNVTRANVLDSIGGTDAAEFTFTTAAGFFYDGIEFTPDVRNAWVEFELKSGATNALTQINIDIRTDGGAIPFRVMQAIPSVWQRFRFPWNPKTAVLQTIQFRAINYSAGVRDKVQMGRVRIYHATEPLHWGARYLEASAVYDPPNLVDGAGTTTTITVTGATLGDYALAAFSLDLQGITVTAYVSAADTVSIRFQNESGGALDLASGTLRARVLTKDS